MARSATRIRPSENLGADHQWRLDWIPLKDMQVSPVAQRKLDPSWVSKLAADFNIESMGFLTVNYRDGVCYIIDGQHRHGALLEMGWGDQRVECRVYDGLTEQEEAQYFLIINNQRNVAKFSEFMVAKTAGDPTVLSIVKTVEKCGLVVAQGKTSDSVSCVVTLQKVHDRIGPKGLERTLKLITACYGDVGLESSIIEGIGLMVERFNKTLDDEKFVLRMSRASGGINGLKARAAVVRNTTRRPLPHCTAAAAVDIYNQGRGGTKLPSWWKTDS